MVVNLLEITKVERANIGTHTTTTKKAFEHLKDAENALLEEFHKYCDEYDIEELSKYDYLGSTNFHIQENVEDGSFGDWSITADITVLDLL